MKEEKKRRRRSPPTPGNSFSSRPTRSMRARAIALSSGLVANRRLLRILFRWRATVGSNVIRLIKRVVFFFFNSIFQIFLRFNLPSRGSLLLLLFTRGRKILSAKVRTNFEFLAENPMETLKYRSIHSDS